jgi:nitrogen-specific signal transduction histidine kinase/PAS domain-containing protein
MIVILTLVVVIIGVILNRITLYSIRKNSRRAKDMATIMQRTLNDNNYVLRLNLQNHLAYNLYGDFLPANGMTYEESLEYIHPDDRHLYTEFIIQLVKGAESSECIFRWDSSLDKHEHTWRYIHDVGIVEYDEADKKTPINFYCTLNDQTEQILIEKEERELTDRYRKLFEQSIVGQAFYDKDGRLLTANQKLRDILKFKSEDDPFYHRYSLFDLPTFRYVLHKDMTEDLYFCTKTVLFERGVNCYTEIRVHPIYNEAKELEFFTLYIRDITQERELYQQNKENEISLQRTNQAIEQYETELKYLMENVDMRFFRTSFEKQEVTFYREMNVIEGKMSFDELIAHFIDDPFAEGLQHPYEFFNEPKSTLTHMRPFFNGGNELKWNFIESIPYYDENGKQAGTYGVVRNVTPLINKQEQLKEETERANQSGIRKSTFLASMSHEIRTPLNAIVGFSDVLATMSTPEEREGIIQVISNNCDMLLRLVNDILALSSLESGDITVKPSNTDFAQCFENVATSLAQRIKNPNIEFKVENPYPVLYATIDGGRIQQVITNFVTNAIKYTHKGHIKIGYEQQIRHDKEGLYIYCEDTGDGIPKEHQGKVFDRFVKLNDFIQGTGLGLSICKIIADNSGGEIGVSSEGKGCGSTFWIWIPCKQDN